MQLVGNIPQMSAKAIGRHRITLATCVTAGSLFYHNLPADHFSHIVIDEAGQATEPEAMNPLGTVHSLTIFPPKASFARRWFIVWRFYDGVKSFRTLDEIL